MNRTHKGVSGYTISIGFRGLMGDQRTLRFLGVTTLEMGQCQLMEKMEKKRLKTHFPFLQG